MFIKKNNARRGSLYSMLSGNQGGQNVRTYKFGGKYENGGVHGDDQAGEAEVRVMVKDSYNTATNPQPGTDYIIMVEGQPTDYSISDMPNFFRSEGLGGPQLETTFYEFLDQFPKSSRTPEEEQAYRKEQFNKALRDVGNIAEGRPYGEAVTPGAFAKENLGNVIRDVNRGGVAAPGAINYSGRYSPTGQKGTPKNVNADEFLRVLGTQFKQ